MLPNFLIIGAPRAGTTWLYECLKEHPQVFMSRKKELDFFSKDFEKGMPYYESFFEDTGGADVIGEASPSYLSDEKSPERIAKYIPKAKLIVILRDPIDRAYSHYTIFKRFHDENNFEEAIENRPGLLTRGLYHDSLMKYYEFFDKKDVLVLFYEDIKKNELDLLNKIYVFLNIDEAFVPTKLKQATNLTIFPRLQSFLYTYRIDFIIDLVKKTPLNQILRNATMKKNSTKPSGVKLETLDKLKEYYKEPNKKLEILLNKKLTDWQ